jgi:hypothetical protein
MDELHAFAAAVRGATDWPIPLWQQLQATRIGNVVEGLLQGAGLTVPPDPI